MFLQMPFFSQYVRPMFVAWLVFLLAGVPMPVTHCHAFELGTPQSGHVLQLHLCDCSHEPVEDHDEAWHLHWICFHFSDDPAGTLSSAHVDVVGNVTAVKVEPRCDISRCYGLEAFSPAWLSHVEHTELRISALSKSYLSRLLTQHSKWSSDYCETSSRLLL